ncbi:Obp99c.2 family protein [Megaselia abdita]
MKLFLIACALLAAVSAQEWKPRTPEELQAIRKTCIEKTKLAPEQVENLKKFVYTEPMKDYMLCFAKEIGIWETGKGFDTKRAVKQYKFDLPEEQVQAIFTKCLQDHQKEGDASKYIIPVQNCMMSSAIGDKIKAKALAAAAPKKQ